MWEGFYVLTFDFKPISKRLKAKLEGKLLIIKVSEDADFDFMNMKWIGVMNMNNREENGKV